MLKKSIISYLFGGLVSLSLGASVSWAQLSPQESLKSFKPADGFEVSLWAQEPMVNNPTGMDIDSRGRVWIVEGVNYRLYENDFSQVPGADRIKILQDSNGDGVADKMTVFAENISPMPLGLAVQEIWKDGSYSGTRVFIGLSTELVVLEDTDGDDRADRRYSILSGFRGNDTEHGLHGMVLGPDGKLYFTQGDARYGTDKVEEGETTFDIVDKSGRHLKNIRQGTTLRVDLDGSNFEVIARGQRNNYEASVSSWGDVFVSDNDDNGDRGCRMVWAMPGGDNGYRTPGSARQWAEELPGVVPKLVGTGNGGPTGILVYEGDLFPPEYHGAVLQLDAVTHQVNFHPLQRYGAAFRSDYRVMLRSDDSWVRLADSTVAPDGSLFVCDWYDGGVGGSRLTDQDTGRIYVVKPSGSKPHVEARDFATREGLIEALKSPNVATRFAARQGLVAHGAATHEVLAELFKKGRAHERARALFVLAELPETGEADLIAALKDADPRMRELALRILASDLSSESVVVQESVKTVEPRAVRVLGDILPLIDDPDAGVRRELILALRNVETVKAGDALLELARAWDGRDRFYLEALHLALRHRDGDYLGKLFTSLGERVLANGRQGKVVALPPYYPVTTNDAFLHIGDQLPPANAASKLIGLAWVLRHSEALPELRAILEGGNSPDIVRGVDMALAGIEDPRAAELLIGRFLVVDDSQRRREILRRLGSGLAGSWKAQRDEKKMRQVFDTALGRDDLRIEAIKTIARSKAAGYESRLMALTGDEQQELSTRAAALDTLGKLHHEPARNMAARIIEQAKGQSQGGPLAQAALSTMSDFSGDKTQQLFTGVMNDEAYPLDFRRQAMQLLAATPDGGQQLVVMHRGKRLPDDLSSEATFLLHNHPDRKIRRIAHREIPLPQMAGGEPITDLDEVLALDGNADKGRGMFQRLGCIACHRVQGVGLEVGPDLSSIGTKYGKRELLYHILNPSGAISYNYVYYTLSLKDGRTLAGLIVDENAERVVLKTAQGQRIEIASDEIKTRQALNTSIMPPVVAGMVNRQELADLITHLATLRQAVVTVGEYYLLGPLAQGTYDGSIDPDLQKPWSAFGGGMTRWQRVSTSRDNYLKLSSLLGSKAGSEVNCFVPCISPGVQDARLVFDTASTIKLWHNGQPVTLTRSDKNSVGAYWQALLKLQEGTNRFTIRVASGQVDSGLSTTLITDQAIRFDFD